MTADSPSVSASATAGRLLLALATLAYFALALYGSLVPFQFDRSQTFDHAWQQFQHVPYLDLRIQSRADWVANILLFIPLAFLATGTLALDRPRWFAPLASLLVLPACVALCVAIEFTQLFFPPRTVSQNDMLAESLGALLGCLAWCLAGPTLAYAARQAISRGRQRGLATLLVPTYLAALLIVHLMPLDLTISPVEVYHKYREGRILLIPFQTSFPTLEAALQKHAWLAIYYLPLGAIAAHLPWNFWQRLRAWPLVLAAALSVASAIEAAQLFVYTRSCDSTDILVSTFWMLAGWLAALRFSRRLPHAAATSPSASLQPSPAFSFPWLALALLLALANLALFWFPYRFQWDVAPLRDKLSRFSLVPFADYYRGTEYQAFDQLLQKSLFIAPLGWAAACAWPGSRRFWQHALLWLPCLALVALVEAGQFLLPEKLPSITDALVRLLAVGIGYAAARRWGPPAAHHHATPSPLTPARPSS